MFGLDPIFTGILILLLIVPILFAAQRLFLRAMPRFQPPPPPPNFDHLTNALDLTDHQNATLLVQPGGKIVHVNAVAREWFNINEDDYPSLEHLARRARPSDTFLSLCAGVGQANFSLQGRMIQGTSFQVPYEGSLAIFISLNRPDLSNLVDKQTSASTPAVNILSEINRMMSSSLDLEETLTAILEGIERIVPTDLIEIMLWNSNKKILEGYTFVGIAGVDRHLEKSPNQYQVDEGYTGHVFSQNKPLFVEDVETFRDIRPLADRRTYPFRSYMGVPLSTRGRTLGTVEVGALAPNAYTENDLDLLKLITEQAAVALDHAITHAEEERRVTELTGLARLSRAIGNIRSTRDLIEQLLDSIAPLLDVEILGFLIFQEETRELAGQLPFMGMPDQFISLYRSTIETNSPAEEILQAEKLIQTQNAPENPDLETLGLGYLQQAAGIMNTILVPLASGGRRFGYLQAANKRDGTLFSEEDIRILSIAAGQIAPIMDNANLLSQSRRRTRQAEALRRIAALVSSAATLDEILRFVLLELIRLLGIKTATVFLLNDTFSALELHRNSAFGLETIPNRMMRIPVDSDLYRVSVTNTQDTLAAGKNTPSEMNEYYQQIARGMGASSLMVLPIVVRNRAIGELLLAAPTEDYFTHTDLELVATASGQLAGAVERSTLYTQTDASLRRKVEQLATMTRLTRELNSYLDLDKLLDLIYHEQVYNTSADGGMIILFEDGPNTPIRKQIGQAPLEANPPLQQKAVRRKDLVFVDNFVDSEEDPAYPNAGTELVIPLVTQQKVIGLVHLYALTPYRFDKDTNDSALYLASQAAVALDNATRYQQQLHLNEELSTRMATLRKLLETNQILRRQETLPSALETIATGLQQATPFESVLISLYDESDHMLTRAVGLGIDAEKMEELRENRVKWSNVEAILQPDFRFTQSYFIPEDKLPIVPPEIHTLNVMAKSVNGNPNRWHPDDIFIVPLYNQDQQPVGLISVDAPSDGMRPNQSVVETLEVFAAQTALTIEGFQRIERLNGALQTTQLETERAQLAAKSAQEHLPVLLRKDLDHHIAIRRLNDRTLHIRMGMEISQALAQQHTSEDVYRTLASEMVARLGFDNVLVAEPSDRGPVLRYIAGEFPAQVNPETLLGQRNPLRHSLSTGEILHIENLNEMTETAQSWHSSPMLNRSNSQSFISVPIMEVGKPVVAWLALRQEASPAYTDDDLRVFELIAQQAATSLRNIALIQDTRHQLQEVDLLLDFSRKLSSLNPADILQTLLRTVMQIVRVANTGNVLLWQKDEQKLVSQVAMGYANNARVREIPYQAGEALPGQTFEAGVPLLIDDLDFANDYNLSEENLIAYRESTDGRLPISTLVVPIRTSETRLGVILLENFSSGQSFKMDDQALVLSLAQQTAIILENVRLVEATEERAKQLQSLNTVAAQLTSKLEVDAITSDMLTQLASILPYNTGTLWLRENGQIKVEDVAGFEDGDERLGLTVNIDDSVLMGDMLARRTPLYVPNMHDDPRFFASTEQSNLTWLGIPLLAKGEIIGVIALEKQEENAYDPSSIQVASTFAGQAAVALENARLYQESTQRTQQLDQRNERLNLLNQLSVDLSSSLDPDYLVDIATKYIHQAVDSDVTSAIVFDTRGRAVLQAERPATFGTLPMVIESAPLFDHIRESAGVFITEDVNFETLLFPLNDFLKQRGTKTLVALPLFTASELNGVIFLHTSGDRIPTSQIELASTITNQVAVANANARLFEQTQSGLEEIAIREQYQKSVALAVSLLNKSGTSSLVDAFRIIGEAAQVSGIHYFERKNVNGEAFWEHNNRWLAPKYLEKDTGNGITKIPVVEAKFFETQLANHGYFASITRHLPPRIQERLREKGIQSVLGVAVPGMQDEPGFLIFEQAEYEREWMQDEIDPFSTIAAALSSTISQENLFKQVQDALSSTEEQARRLGELNEMSSALANAKTFDDILEIGTKSINNIFHTPQTHIALLTPDRSEYILLKTEKNQLKERSRQGLAGSEIEQVISTGELIVHSQETPDEDGFRSRIMAPLRTTDGYVGAVIIGMEEENAFGSSEATVFNQVMSLVSSTLNNNQLLEQTRQLTEDLEKRVEERTQELAQEANRTKTLLAVITELSASLDLDIVLNRTLALINRMVEAGQSTIMLAPPAEKLFLRRAAMGYTPPSPTGGERTSLNIREGLAGWVIEHRESALINDLNLDERWIPRPDGEETHRSALAVPLKMGEETLGALLLFHQEKDKFTQQHLEVVEATARQISVALNNAQLFNLIRDQAERLGGLLRTQQIEASRSRAILEAVADGVMVTDNNGQITLFNRSAEQILELDRKTILTQFLDEFVGLFGSAGKDWTNTIRRWSSNPKELSADEVYSERITLEDARVVAVNLSPVTRSDEFLGTVSIFRDITHQVEIDRMKSEFVATVSHELRTPMTSIKGYVDILLLGAAGQLSDQQKSFLQVVHGNIERLSILLNDLLDVSQIEAGRVILTKQALELPKLASEVAASVQEQAEEDEKSIHIEVKPQKKLPRAYGDLERIRLVLDNLIRNGYMYTPAGGHIYIAFEANNGYITTHITDSGIGVSQEEQERIFERFYRGENPLVLASAGTGLGLSIVQQLIHMHGGEIWMTSEGIPGKGSTFSFSLPEYIPES